jgi:hypothetical protein
MTQVSLVVARDGREPEPGAAPGVFRWGDCYPRIGAMLLSPDELLPHCSQCGTWPMPAAFIERGRAWGRIRFRCPGCGIEELHEVGTSAPTLVPRVNAGQGATVSEDSK